MNQLTENVLKSILVNENTEIDFVIQIIGVKKIKEDDVFRLSISDGSNWFSYVIIADRLNYLITS